MAKNAVKVRELKRKSLLKSMQLKGRNLRQKVIGKVWINYQGTPLQ